MEDTKAHANFYELNILYYSILIHIDIPNQYYVATMHIPARITNQRQKHS